MSGETKKEVSGWTLDTVRVYFERVLDEKQAALELAFKAQQEALGLASRTLELRLEKLNELRQEVTSDRGNYVTKDKHESDMTVLTGIAGDNKSRLGEMDLVLQRDYLRRQSYEADQIAIKTNVETLMNWRYWILGFGTAIAFVAGSVGAFIAHLVWK